MDKRAIAHIALAMRELSDSLLAAVGAEWLPGPVPTEEPPCAHPRATREDLSTFGTKGEHWRCKLCGHVHRDTPPTEVVDGR